MSDAISGVQGVAENQTVQASLSAELMRGAMQSKPGAASLDEVSDLKTGITKQGISVNFDSKMSVMDGVQGAVGAYANATDDAELKDVVEAVKSGKGNASQLAAIYQSLVGSGNISFSDDQAHAVDSKPKTGTAMLIEESKGANLKQLCQMLVGMGFNRKAAETGEFDSSKFSKGGPRNSGLLAP